jgi:hypothetical protein
MRYMARLRTSDCDPVGSKDIAARTGVQPNTVHMWQKRGLLPEPRWHASGFPLWDWNVDIVPWLRADARRAHLAPPED